MDLFTKCQDFVGGLTPQRRAGMALFYRAVDPVDGRHAVRNGRRLLMLGSNDYLGLTHDPRVKEAAAQAVLRHGSSSCGARINNGTTSLHQRLEEKLAEIKGVERVMVFSNGFMAMMGTISTLAGQGDVVFCDQENHASLIDGCRASGAEVRVFRHNDMRHLGRLLSEYDRDKGKLVTVDGVFSQTGRITDLPEVVRLAREHGARVMLDDAHATGVLGAHGHGTAEHFSLQGQIDLVGGTFSKALGATGGGRARAARARVRERALPAAGPSQRGLHRARFRDAHHAADHGRIRRRAAHGRAAGGGGDLRQPDRAAGGAAPPRAAAPHADRGAHRGGPRLRHRHHGPRGPRSGSARAVRLAPRMAAVPPNAILRLSAECRRRQALGADVVDLGLGEPDVATPAHVCAAAAQAAAEGHTRYTPPAGMAPLRSAIVRRLSREGLSYAPREVMATAGALGGLACAFHALAGPGDEVLVPAPYYPPYLTQIALVGAHPVIVPTDEADAFKLRPEALRAALTSRSRALVLNTPSNPAGAVYGRAELAALVAVAAEAELVIVADEVYGDLLRGPEPFVSVAACSAEARRRTVVVRSLSKSYAMTGWRLGYAAGPEPLITAMTHVQDALLVMPASVSQWAGLAALTGPQDGVRALGRAWPRAPTTRGRGWRSCPACAARRPPAPSSPSPRWAVPAPT
ncbi:MAG: hypothetical protein DMF78_00105 [Acidobacteria bacterium]|nr:MAG: hypothetical protein DMF78_00105 [Acidobacteriota bacterium]